MSHSENTQPPLPHALVRMFPDGRGAYLAAQILSHADVIERALDDYTKAQEHGSPGQDEASHTAALVHDFRYILAQETAARQANRTSAPLTGTSARSIVQTIAHAILTMPEPKNGGWREAAHAQIWRTGTRYAQMWKEDARYFMYAADAQNQKD